jgi:methionyl-tRNA formyltransferase
MTDYPYASGDLLEKRNTYFYTPYAGADFLLAWRLQREAAAVAGCRCCCGRGPGQHRQVAGDDRGGLHAPVVPPSLVDALARLIQRFEVSRAAR